MNTGPRAELVALRRSVQSFERQFIASYLGAPSLSPPSRAEILNLAAYVMLVHGAIENFVEGVALWVLDRSLSTWTLRRRTTRAIASLLLYRAVPGLDGSSVFDNIRDALQQSKQSLSTSIHDNNGITVWHLRSLFYPLGVNVPEDPILTASIDQLVTMRHEWAHQYRFGAKVAKPAADVQLVVADCLTFAERLSREAASVRP